MEIELPNSFKWFLKLNLTEFVPWEFKENIKLDTLFNRRFKIECNQNREVLTFGKRSDMETFCGFEIVDKKVSEKIIVFHLTFNENINNWNIIKSEYINLF